MVTSDMQLDLFEPSNTCKVAPFKTQLLKWVGNKQRFAHEIASFFPEDVATYYEPFIGSGAVLATYAPRSAVASDAFEPLAQIWKTLVSDPEKLVRWYSERFRIYYQHEKPVGYEQIKASYNSNPNAADLLFLCRSCYGGVVRFRKADGYMSTPCGAHAPIAPANFESRVQQWRERIGNTSFLHSDFEEIMQQARYGDLVYCDPPYTHSQAILYGGQSFELVRLLKAIESCKERGVRVALSIDGTKKSGEVLCDLPIPDDLFEREIYVNCGRSMLRRFQMGGCELSSEVVKDRLLLTY